MKPTSLGQVAVLAEGLLLNGSPDRPVTSVHFDSRQLEAGGLFVAVRSERDGHDFLPSAVAKGAAAAIISDEAKIPPDLPRDFGLILVNDTVRAFEKWAGKYRNQLTLPIIAVTGSNGKTTTKDITAHLLSQAMSVYKTYKSFNNHLGVPYSLLQIDERHQAAVLELGMNHAGEIDRLASLVRPRISIITNIGDAHLEFFGSRRKIALAKGELLPHTARDGLEPLRVFPKRAASRRTVAGARAGQLAFFRGAAFRRRSWGQRRPARAGARRPIRRVLPINGLRSTLLKTRAFPVL